MHSYQDTITNINNPIIIQIIKHAKQKAESLNVQLEIFDDSLDLMDKKSKVSLNALRDEIKDHRDSMIKILNIILTRGLDS
jgi:hypothetical protein